MSGRSKRRRLAALLVLASVAAACTSTTEGAEPGCERTVDASVSVARMWNEALLDAIRRDFPAPTVHSRNLFHVSAAMWDAWAGYDDGATGYYVDESHSAEDVHAAREEAISYAAYRVLVHRYEPTVAAPHALPAFRDLMAALCYPVLNETTEGDSPAAFGNRIAATIITTTAGDGSLESTGYIDETYEPVNAPMKVAQPGTMQDDPNRWQPLEFEKAFAQNQLPTDNIQEFVGPHWGHVASFALPASEIGVPIDPGPPPYLGDPGTDAGFKDSAIEVIGYSSVLDPRDGATIDISPASMGNNPLGTYDGSGRSINPITGEPYQPNVVLRADFGRVIAEFWADGPHSETPPGHWNTLANATSDRSDLRLGGVGAPLDRLEWDVKLYMALNAATHDAAVAAWGVKGYYDYTRPISMIRYMGGLGQSSDPAIESYHEDGLPLIDGLVELITAETSRPGERHDHLADHVREIAIRAWAGNPEDPEQELGGVDWIRAVEWVPYQRSTFVTPAFAGYVSGHSTFSRAAAEVLTAMTGSEFFPGGLGTWTIPANGLDFEQGPSEDVTLQWATYYDASDQAGLSRLYGGIHVRADDLAGRIIGATVGKAAWDLAERYFNGSVPAS